MAIMALKLTFDIRVGVRPIFDTEITEASETNLQKVSLEFLFDTLCELCALCVKTS